MSSTQGPPNASGPPRNNTVNAPFPRANNTARFSLSRRFAPASSSTSSGASKNRVPPITMPNRNVPATLPPPPPPRTGGTMGPPPPLPPARRRNAKFDQMFYTSPLPRSISKAYNDLQAAGGGGGAAVGTTAMVPSTLRTGVTTTAVTRNSPRRQAVGAVGKENVVTTTVVTRVVPTPAAATNTDTVSAAKNGMTAAYTSATIVAAAPAAEKNDMAGHGTATTMAPVAAAPRAEKDGSVISGTMDTTATAAEESDTAGVLVTAAPIAGGKTSVMSKTVTTTAPVTIAPATATRKSNTAMSTTATATVAAIAEPGKVISDEPQDSPELVGPAAKRTQDMDVMSEDAAIKTPVVVPISDSTVPAPPPPGRSFAEAWAEEDDAFMKDVSDNDKEWHPSTARNISKSKSNKKTPAATPVKQGTKRANSSSSRQMPPKKVPRTVAASSPGQTHPRRATEKKSAKTPVALTSRGVGNIKLKPNGTKKSSLMNKAEEKKQNIMDLQSRPKRLSLQKSHMTRAVLPGFNTPPWVLAETGSAWDPGSGRRLSRRVSVGILPSSSFQTPPTNETGSPREIRSGQNPLSSHVSTDTISTPAPPIPSPISSDRDVVDEDEIRAPADTPVVKETPIRKTPRNSLGTTNVVEQEMHQVPDSNTPVAIPSPRRSTRNFLSDEQAPDSDKQTNKPGKQYPKTSYDEPQASTDTHTTPMSRRSTRITPATKKTSLSKFHRQGTPTAVQSPIPPPTPPPFPLKKTRRSLRGPQDLPSAFPANVSEVNKTSLPTLPTPQPPSQGPGSKVEVVIETPQPRARARATRASTVRKKQVNLEFEFSDGELN